MLRGSPSALVHRSFPPFAVCLWLWWTTQFNLLRVGNRTAILTQLALHRGTVPVPGYASKKPHANTKNIKKSTEYLILVLDY